MTLGPFIFVILLVEIALLDIVAPVETSVTDPILIHFDVRRTQEHVPGLAIDQTLWPSVDQELEIHFKILRHCTDFNAVALVIASPTDNRTIVVSSDKLTLLSRTDCKTTEQCTECRTEEYSARVFAPSMVSFVPHVLHSLGPAARFLQSDSTSEPSVLDCIFRPQAGCPECRRRLGDVEDDGARRNFCQASLSKFSAQIEICNNEDETVTRVFSADSPCVSGYDPMSLTLRPSECREESVYTIPDCDPDAEFRREIQFKDIGPDSCNYPSPAGCPPPVIFENEIAPSRQIILPILYASCIASEHIEVTGDLSWDVHVRNHCNRELENIQVELNSRVVVHPSTFSLLPDETVVHSVTGQHVIVHQLPPKSGMPASNVHATALDVEDPDSVSVDHCLIWDDSVPVTGHDEECCMWTNVVTNECPFPVLWVLYDDRFTYEPSEVSLCTGEGEEITITARRALDEEHLFFVNSDCSDPQCKFSLLLSVVQLDDVVVKTPVWVWIVLGPLIVACLVAVIVLVVVLSYRCLNARRGVGLGTHQRWPDETGGSRLTNQSLSTDLTTELLSDDGI